MRGLLGQAPASGSRLPLSYPRFRARDHAKEYPDSALAWYGAESGVRVLVQYSTASRRDEARPSGRDCYPSTPPGVISMEQGI
jgi:hypothetical protein